MVVADLDKCVGCGLCQMVCPRQALNAWGYVRIDRDRCNDCHGGLHRSEEDAPLGDRAIALDTTSMLRRRACIENCPVEALSVE